MKFEWDPLKNKANILKHKVSFEEAETVFDDKNAKYIFDKAHSDNEDRFHIIGVDASFKELNVCHCYLGADEDVIRIISARKVAKTEVNYYFERIEQ